jgi:hypothetical protein
MAKARDSAPPQGSDMCMDPPLQLLQISLRFIRPDVIGDFFYRHLPSIRGQILEHDKQKDLVGDFLQFEFDAIALKRKFAREDSDVSDSVTP